ISLPFFCLHMLTTQTYTLSLHDGSSDLDGSSSMPIIFSKVDLPEPEGPIMEMNSLWFTLKLMSLRIYVFWPPALTDLEMLVSTIIMFFLKGKGIVDKCI